MLRFRQARLSRYYFQGDTTMNKTIGALGNTAGLLGLLICAVSGVARITGQYHLAGFEAMTLFNGGVGLMVAASLFKLHALERR